MAENPYQSPIESKPPRTPANYRLLTNLYIVATFVLMNVAIMLNDTWAIRQVRAPMPGSEVSTLLMRVGAIATAIGAIYCFVAASVCKYRDWRKPKSELPADE